MQKIGPNMSTYEANDRPSSTVARTSQLGSAPLSFSRTSPRPGASRTTAPRAASRAIA